MNINKLVIIFDSNKLKSLFISASVLPYRYFFEGFYSSEVREKNKLNGYEINYLNSAEKDILASRQIISDVSFNKYAVNVKTLEKLSNKIQSYTSLTGKIFLVEIGSIYLLSQEYRRRFIELLASEKKIIILAKKSKEIESTMNKLFDTLVVNMVKKTFQDVKKVSDRFILDVISNMRFNE